MNVEIFCIAEAVSLFHGRTSVLNTFNNWAAREFPTMVTGTVLLHMRLRPDEEGSHIYQVVLTDADGQEKGNFGPMAFDCKFASAQRETFCFATAIPMLAEVFEGQHELRLFFDGREAMAIPLGVQPVSKI